MPTVNGKKYPYTAKGIAAAKAARKGMEGPGFGPNPADDIYVDEGGIRPEKPKSPSAKAEGSRTKARKRTADLRTARRSAVKAFMDQFNKTGKIPASPTR